MKRIKIFKAYFILWLFVYFIAVSNAEIFSLYFMSTLTFNIAIVTILGIGTFMLLKGAKDVVMLAGTFGVLMYKKRNLPFYIKGIEKVLPHNIANKIRSRVEHNMLLFTQQEKEEILAWIEEKFANQNKYNNFFIGTVLMIGLLGTFAGLLGAISSMGNIVLSLSGNNIDIGKIMASFSGPLGSMAVGFGSSLFGVISAILLSIKGYLLNKSQASLIDGVENWLNEKTVDVVHATEENGFIHENPLIEQQPAFMDIFVNKVGSLSQQIAYLNNHNKILRDEFTGSMQVMQSIQEEQSNILIALHKSLEQIQAQTYINTQTMQQTLSHFDQVRQEQQTFFSDLLEIQQVHTSQMIQLNSSVEDLSYVTEKSLKYNSKHEEKLNHIVATQKNHHDNDKVALFSLIDTMEGMQKTLQKEIKNISKQKPSSMGENSTSARMSFLEKHFIRKEKSNVKEV